MSVRVQTKLCSVTAALLLAVSAAAQTDTADSLSAGPRFHWETSFSEMGIKGESIGWGRNLPLYKTYDDAPRTRLVPPVSTETGIADVIRRRQSIRSFVAEPLTLEQLSQILLSGNGITQVRGDVAHRAAPSGGAKYPMEIYVIAADVDSLSPGLYHFQVADSTLELIREGDFNGDIHRAANSQDAVGASPATFILSARFARSTGKYADRGYRYVYIETGAILENIQLQAVALGLGTVPVGAFNDDAVNALLDIDGVHEAAILIMPLGVPAGP